CGGCYPDIEAALLAALDDCTEEVRWEAAKAFRTAAGSPCEHCKSKSCCGPKVQKRLRAVVEDKDDKGCFVEPSARVRRMARLALAQCGGAVYDELLLVPEEGPSEGPAEEVEEEVVVETAGGPAASNSNKTQLTSQSGTSTRDPIDDAGLNSSVRVRSASMDGAESDGTQNIQATDTQNADTQNSDAQNDAKAQTVSVMKSSTTATRTTPTKANATKTAATKTTSTRTSATKSATKSAAPRAATPATSTAPSQPGTVQIITLPTAPCRDCQTSTTPSRSSNAGFPAMQATGIETANNNVVQLGTEPASATNQVVQAVGADPVVYRSEIAKFYEANQDRFRLPADLRAEVLSTRFDKHASRAEAYQVLFARRIALLKEDQSAAAESAGAIQVLDLGWLGREQFDSVAIAESVFNTPVGGISPMWADENGWHAIRVLERRQPKVRPLAEVADEIYHELVWQKKLASGASHATHLQAAE
ncbi:MAG: peptidylprolyl isomerase, partial [Planctomycetota bacterium]|nr:peptidylprolyl isomerase [Planctomycetota bacterium]